MEIAMRSIVYITIALVSLAALLLLVPKIVKLGEEEYCKASALASIFGWESNCYKEEGIKVKGEADVVAMVVSCHSRPYGLCFLAYKEEGFDEDLLNASLAYAGLGFNVSVKDVNGKSVIRIENKPEGVVVIG